MIPGRRTQVRSPCSGRVLVSVRELRRRRRLEQASMSLNVLCPTAPVSAIQGPAKGCRGALQPPCARASWKRWHVRESASTRRQVSDSSMRARLLDVSSGTNGRRRVCLDPDDLRPGARAHGGRPGPLRTRVPSMSAPRGPRSRVHADVGRRLRGRAPARHALDRPKPCPWRVAQGAPSGGTVRSSTTTCPASNGPSRRRWPSGHVTSTASTCLSMPRPTCTRGSFAAR